MQCKAECHNLVVYLTLLFVSDVDCDMLAQMVNALTVGMLVVVLFLYVCGAGYFLSNYFQCEKLQ